MILVTQDTREIAELDRRIVEAKDAVNEANQTLRSAADGNQIYRLAASWYRVSTSKVTQEQFAAARLVFATFSVIAVALAGSMAAACLLRPQPRADRPTNSRHVDGQTRTRSPRLLRA